MEGTTMGMMILKNLIVMILLGLLSAALSYYGKNYYVRVFDDILGREEDKNPETRVGRGFIYGFFFVWYFVLVLLGLGLLIALLIVAGVAAAIVFVIVWITEKILPQDWFGGLCLWLFDKVGLKGNLPPAEVAQPVAPADIPAGGPAPSPGVSQEEKSPEGPKQDPPSGEPSRPDTPQGS
jgi:hypothetical protein